MYLFTLKTVFAKSKETKQRKTWKKNFQGSHRGKPQVICVNLTTVYYSALGLFFKKVNIYRMWLGT